MVSMKGMLGQDHQYLVSKDNLRKDSKHLELVYRDIYGPMATCSLGGDKVVCHLHLWFFTFPSIYAIQSRLWEIQRIYH